MEPVPGRSPIVATFAQFMRMGGQVDVEISLPVMEVIEVHEGLVVEWRDYFDLGQFISRWSSAAEQ